MGRRKKGKAIHGWLVLEKPVGMTSTQAVGAVRRLFDARKAGHAGILVFFVTFCAFPFYWMLITTFKTTQDLLRPEQLVREATRDIVKDEIRQHLEKTLKEDPQLAQDLRDAVRGLLETEMQPLTLPELSAGA